MAHILVCLGHAGLRHSSIQEVDINPLVVKAGVPLAVDANVVVKAKTT
jgi:hypothetical protein